MASKEEQFGRGLARSIQDEVDRRVAGGIKAAKQKADVAHNARQAAEVAKKEALKTLDQKKLGCQDLTSQLEHARGELRKSRVTIEALQVSLTAHAEKKT
jgi:uncharacterized membrane protein